MGVNAGNFKVLVLFPEKAQSKFLYVISLNRTAMYQQVINPGEYNAAKTVLAKRFRKSNVICLMCNYVD